MKLGKLTYVLLLTLATLVSCTEAVKKEKADIEVIDFSQMPSMVGDSVNTLVSESGIVIYRMEAPKLAIYDNVDTPYWDFPEGLHIITYTEDGKEEGDIRSDFAIYHVQTELWELRKSVEAKNDEDKTIETELLYWNQKTELIYTDAFVKVTEDGLLTKGYGFESDQNFENWTLEDFEVEYIEQ